MEIKDFFFFLAVNIRTTPQARTSQHFAPLAGADKEPGGPAAGWQQVC